MTHPAALPPDGFTTVRMRCRPWRAADLAALLAVYGDADAMRWVGDGRPLTRADCERWLEVTAQNYRLRGYGMFAWDLLGTADVVGFCGLVHPGGQPQAEVKVALRRERWGRGLATEAVRGLLAQAGPRWGLQEVIATVAPQNAASLRALAKAGLQPSGLRQNDDGSTTQMLRWQAVDSQAVAVPTERVV